MPQYIIFLLNVAEKKMEIVKSGLVPKVKIEAQNYRNKKVTTIQGIDLWWIEPKELISELRKKLSVGVSETEEFVFPTIIVQGSKINECIEMLTENFCVPFKYI